VTDALPCQRELFDIPDDVAYLNAAYMGPLPRPALEAGEQGLRAKARPWHIHAGDFFTGPEAFRAAAARLLHGDPDGIAIIPAVSYGVAIAMRNLPLGPGGRVLIVEEEFPSDVYGWRALAARRRGEVVTVERPVDDDWTAAILRQLDDGVSIVSVPNCHWTDGGLVDLVRVAEAARSVRAALVVDATQSLGALPLDVGAIQPDFVLCAGYKWLLGPYSVGFAWVAPQHRNGEPIEHNWIAREGSEDFAGLVHYTEGLHAGARRYDVGERTNFALLPAATAAFELMHGWGAERIAAGARELGLMPTERHAAHMLGLRLPRGAPDDLAARLSRANVFVSVRGDAVRVSPHVYNTPADIDRLIDALGRA
jgi:selenocysteine lyase/cysteine desulfurase